MYCPQCAAQADQYLAAVSQVMVCTGTLNRQFEIVQVVMSLCAGTDSPEAVFSRTVHGLKEQAQQLQCQAVVNVQFEHRTFTKEQAAFLGTNYMQGIEFFAFGTAVRFQ